MRNGSRALCTRGTNLSSKCNKDVQLDVKYTNWLWWIAMVTRLRGDPPCQSWINILYPRVCSVHKIWASTWDFQQCGMGNQQMLRPACAYAQSDQSLCLSLDYSMNIKPLTNHHLEFLSLKKRGCTGASESTLVKMPHCWKSHATAHIVSYNKAPQWSITMSRDMRKQQCWCVSRVDWNSLLSTWRKRLFLAVPRGCLQFVIVVFPDHTHYFSWVLSYPQSVQRRLWSV